MGKIKNLIRKLSAIVMVPAVSFALVAIASAQNNGGNMNTNPGAPTEESYTPAEPNNPTSPNAPTGPGGPTSPPSNPDQSTGAPSLNATSSEANSVMLQVRYPSMAGSNANVQVAAWNMDANSTAMKNYTVALDSQGNGMIKIENLKTKTNYAFFVKVRMNNGSYSDPSIPAWIKTM